MEDKTVIMDGLMDGITVIRSKYKHLCFLPASKADFIKTDSPNLFTLLVYLPKATRLEMRIVLQ